MNKYPITYESCESKYSQNRLKILSRKFSELNDIGYSADEQRHAGAKCATRMSIQSLKPKLSAILSVQKSKFKLLILKKITS